MAVLDDRLDPSALFEHLPRLEPEHFDFRMRLTEILSSAESCGHPDQRRHLFEELPLHWRVDCPVQARLAVPVIGQAVIVAELTCS